MKAQVTLYNGYNGGQIVNQFETEGKPPYGMGQERDPQRVNFCGMPYEAPASINDYHVSKEHQTMIWYDYNPKTRETRCVNIPPKGRIEIEAR